MSENRRTVDGPPMLSITMASFTSSSYEKVDANWEVEGT